MWQLLASWMCCTEVGSYVWLIVRVSLSRLWNLCTSSRCHLYREVQNDSQSLLDMTQSVMVTVSFCGGYKVQEDPTEPKAWVLLQKVHLSWESDSPFHTDITA